MFRKNFFCTYHNNWFTSICDGCLGSIKDTMFSDEYDTEYISYDTTHVEDYETEYFETITDFKDSLRNDRDWQETQQWINNLPETLPF